VPPLRHPTREDTMTTIVSYETIADTTVTIEADA
jgi:hypothetical protein